MLKGNYVLLVSSVITNVFCLTTTCIERCLFQLFVVTEVEGCTAGFPDMNLLINRAAQINGNSVGSTLGDNELRILSHMKFNCTGKITSLILGVDVRTETSSRSLFPAISLWTCDMTQTGLCTKVNGSERNIVLGPSNFSTSGVFEYPLNPPVQFTDGDILGWFQPNDIYSVVRMYQIQKDNFNSISFLHYDPREDVANLIQSTTVSNKAFIIYLVIGELTLYMN